MASEYKICKRCVNDTTIPDVGFDETGVCKYCRLQDILEQRFPMDSTREERLKQLVQKMKDEGRGRPYDCVVGVSGGRDSTWLLHKVVELGLRPLAAHFDNGWNSEIAVTNIKNVTDILKVDLYTVVADWDEFKDLQKSFLKASVPDAEIPTDVGLKGALYKAASDNNVRNVITGYSFRTEGITPLSWNYMDGRYISSVQRLFGKKSLKKFPNVKVWNFFYNTFIKRIRFNYIMPLLVYRHDEVQNLLENKLGWRYYGGHHQESYYTHFFQRYYLIKKFNIDERITEYSAMIRSGQMTREDALEKLKTPPVYPQEGIDYVLSKLEMSPNEFKEIMTAPNKSFHDYGTYFPLIQALRFPIKWGVKAKVLPEIFHFMYLKFLGS
jgi:N-acetyl sugar amidotransferase